MIRKLATAAAIAATTLAVAGPASAADARIESQTLIKLMPGHGYEFHEGDPVRICVGTMTETRALRAIHIVLEERQAKPGAKWKVVQDFVGYPNTVGCLMGVVHGSGSEQLRARTIQNPEVARSTSRVVTLTTVN